MRVSGQAGRLLAVLVLGVGVGALGAAGFAETGRLHWTSGEYPEAFAASMEASSAAFERKDMEATRSHLHADFATYELHGEDSPKLLVRGRDKTIEVMNTFFAGDFGSSWQGADVERLGSIGNTMVQIEHDRYQAGEGTRTISTFVIIQYKDDKRWREWRLIPDPA